MRESWMIINETKDNRDQASSNVIKIVSNKNWPTCHKANSINEYFLEKKTQQLHNYQIKVDEFHINFFVFPTTPTEVISRMQKLHPNR